METPEIKIYHEEDPEGPDIVLINSNSSSCFRSYDQGRLIECAKDKFKTIKSIEIICSDRMMEPIYGGLYMTEKGTGIVLDIALKYIKEKIKFPAAWKK
jgi:hypothetical protein